MDETTLRFLAHSYVRWLHQPMRGSEPRDSLECNIEALLEEYDEQLIDILRDINAGELDWQDALNEIDEVFNWGDRGIK